MAIKFIDKYAADFIGADELTGISGQVKLAHDQLHSGTGLGNDFIG